MIYLIYQDESAVECTGYRKSLVAVCDSKARAESMIKEMVDNPACGSPIIEKCSYDEDLCLGQIENKYGYYCFYYIEEAYMNEYIE